MGWDSKVKLSKKKLFVACLCVASAFFAWAIFDAFNTPAPKITNDDFDSVRWKKNAGYDRDHLVYYLTEGKLTIGLTKKQIIDLLGKPDGDQRDDVWDWDIRPDSASFETLILTFKNGRVVKCEHHING
jgi:hypothetical protein